MATKSFKDRKAEALAAKQSERPALTDVVQHNENSVVEEAQPKGKKEKESLQEYEILEAGVIIDDVKFPNADAKKGEEMIHKMTHTEAQSHQMHGIPLRRRE